MPVILKVGAEERLTQPARCETTRQRRSETSRFVSEEVGQVSETPSATGGCIREVIELHSLHTHAEFQGMCSVREKSVVITLERVPVVEVDVGRAQTSEEFRNSATNPYVGRSFSWNRTQGNVLCKGIDRRQRLLIGRNRAVVARPNCVDQGRGESMTLLQGGELPARV